MARAWAEWPPSSRPLTSPAAPGADVVIASGRAPNVITRIVGGESIGTRFPALESPLENRKRWIFGGTRSEGSLRVDAGAARALRNNGSSLLPAGIVAVEGAVRPRRYRHHR